MPRFVIKDDRYIWEFVWSLFIGQVLPHSNYKYITGRSEVTRYKLI